MTEIASTPDKRHWSEEAFERLCETLQGEGILITQASHDARRRAFGDFDDRHGNPITMTITRITSPEVRLAVTFSRCGNIFSEVRADSAQAWWWIDRGFPLPWTGLRSISFALIMIRRYIDQLKTELEH